MIKRTVEVFSRKSRVYSKQKQLKVDVDGCNVGSVPFEDVGLLVLDSPALTCTQGALVSIAENGGAVMICGKDHHPAGLFLPMVANTTLTKRLLTQTDVSKPLKKRLWAQIIKRKIKNQAAVLDKDSPAISRLKELSKNVKAGDLDNKEGQAARIYWKELFPDIDFKREREGFAPNSLLNYGYMVFRATIARAICGSGLHPALGLHHKNKYNPFCLADDLLEPYRPFVDMEVKDLVDEGLLELERETKTRLLSLLSKPVLMNKEKGPLMVAFGKTTASLYKCFIGESKKLLLPEL